MYLIKYIIYHNYEVYMNNIVVMVLQFIQTIVPVLISFAIHTDFDYLYYYFLPRTLCLETAVRFMNDPHRCHFDLRHAKNVLQDGKFSLLCLLLLCIYI